MLSRPVVSPRGMDGDGLPPGTSGLERPLHATSTMTVRQEYQRSGLTPSIIKVSGSVPWCRCRHLSTGLLGLPDVQLHTAKRLGLPSSLFAFRGARASPDDATRLLSSQPEVLGLSAGQQEAPLVGKSEEIGTWATELTSKLNVVLNATPAFAFGDHSLPKIRGPPCAYPKLRRGP